MHNPNPITMSIDKEIHEKSLKDKFNELDMKEEKAEFMVFMEKAEFFNSLSIKSEEKSEFEDVLLDNTTGLKGKKEENYA